jgi:hypothetical protein
MSDLGRREHVAQELISTPWRVVKVMPRSLVVAVIRVGPTFRIESIGPVRIST